AGTGATRVRSPTGDLGGEAHRRQPGSGPSRSGRQPGPALAAAGLQDRAPGTVGHPLAESVLLGTLSVVRLVGTLHGSGLLGLRATAHRGHGRARGRSETTRVRLSTQIGTRTGTRRRCAKIAPGARLEALRGR